MRSVPHWQWITLLAAVFVGCGDNRNDDARDAAVAAPDETPDAASARDASSTSSSDASAGSDAGGCGALGQDCLDPARCGAHESCIDGLDLCFPSDIRPSDSNCPRVACANDKPLCIGGQCMTPEQAACVCAQATAKERVDACKQLPK
jgi:hypothetical protein